MILVQFTDNKGIYCRLKTQKTNNQTELLIGNTGKNQMQ